MNTAKPYSNKKSVPFSYRALWVIALLTILSAVLMIYWRILQICPSIQSILAHKEYERTLIVRIAVLRQILRMSCILYGILQILASWHFLFLNYEEFLRRKTFFQKTAVLLSLAGVILQYLSLADLYTNIIMTGCLLFQGIQTILILTRNGFRFAISAALLAYGLFLLGSLVFGYTYCRTEEPNTNQKGVSTEAGTTRNIYHQIWDMSTENEFYHAAFYEQKPETNYGLIPVPGMTYADSTTGGPRSRGETCTSMTPQGIAVSDNYIFVSAYCYTHRHNSVIFVIDRETGAFIKELVLPEKSHVGGLAYDTNYGTLWIASKMKQETANGMETVSALACITDDAIFSYSFADTGLPIKYENICPTQFKSNSCLAYKDGYIYIGYWMKSKMAMSIAGKFEVQKNGISVKSRASEIFHIPGQVQGISVDEDQIYFTISYGLKKSTILMYNNDEGKNKMFFAASPEKFIEMPQMLEEICLYDDMLYTLFESSAFAYRYTAPVCMDHIVKIRTAVFQSP